MITIEMIQERLEKLEIERERLQANIYAYDGAIEDCKYWLEQLGEAKKEEE